MLDIARRIFGTKASATTRLDVQSTMGSQAVWTNRNYRDLAREGYEHSTWVFACINALTRQTAYVRPLLYRERRGGAMEELDTHPILDLLSRPNDEQALEKFIEEAYATYLVSGNAYIERVGLENRPPLELYVKRPDRMKVYAGNAEQRIGGYDYQINGEKLRFKPWQILHLKTWSPLDDWYGLSPLAAAARGVDVFNAGQAHNLALLQNGARPSGAWVNSSTMTDDQFRRLREQIDDATRVNNRGRPLLLEGGISWQELGVNPRDLDFLAGQEDAARQIHAAYGVHPVLTGLQSGTFENQREAIRNLVNLTVFPFLDMLFGELTRWITPAYGEGFRISFDKNAFPAFSDDESELMTRARDAYRDGIITLNEARAMIGYESVDEGEVFAFTPRSGNEMNLINLASEPVLQTKSTDAPTDNRVIDDEDDEYYMTWKARDNLRQVWEMRLQLAAEKGFKAQRRRINEAMRDATTDTAELLAMDAILIDDFDELRETWLAAMLDSGKMTLDELKTQRRLVDPEDYGIFREIFGLAFDEVLEAAATRTADLVTLIDDTTRREIRDLMGDSFRQGLSIPNIAARIDQLYLDEIIPNRSTVIARTEAIRSSNYGNLKAAEGTGLTLTKRWVATRDLRTREGHWNADGQTVPLDATFKVAAELGFPLEDLDFPGDPNGSAANTIQCRCTMTYQRRRD